MILKVTGEAVHIEQGRFCIVHKRKRVLKLTFLRSGIQASGMQVKFISCLTLNHSLAACFLQMYVYTTFKNSTLNVKIREKKAMLYFVCFPYFTNDNIIILLCLHWLLINT